MSVAGMNLIDSVHISCVLCCGRRAGVSVRVGVWTARVHDGVGMEGYTWIKAARAGRDCCSVWATDPVRSGHSVHQVLRLAGV